MSKIVSMERIEQCIYLIRGQREMPDSDLAKLYGVETKALIQAVKRNLIRFHILGENKGIIWWPSRNIGCFG